MPSRPFYSVEYELAPRSSTEFESTDTLDPDDEDSEAQLPSGSRRGGPRRFLWLPWICSYLLAGYHLLKFVSRLLLISAPRWYLPRIFCRRRCRFFQFFFSLILALIFVVTVFCPSYTRPPVHYSSLRTLAQRTNDAGRGNPHNEKVFIAASIYDCGGELAGGQWGTQLLELIHLLGNENVFVSIYENDGGAKGQSALRELGRQISSRKSIVFEEHLDPQSLPDVSIPGGERRIKRIEYLAQVRNKALRPLEDDLDTRYDRLLYLNDILFDPVDALQLLFSTNVNEHGKAQYRAACAVDFANPFKFYDTYATRDLQGYSMGLPFYPWFSTAGSGESRRDVIEGKDAVRVRSCWGGMVAFDAKYFQTPLPHKSSPARFRSSDDLFWEASECCLIHADIQDPQSDVDEIVDTGIYMNPFIRVAYDSRTLSWLWLTRRFERLYSAIHNIGNHLVSLPRDNPRRTEVPGQSVNEMVWTPDSHMEGGGSLRSIDRTTSNDGYCGRRGLQVVVENRQPGQEGYETVPVPVI